MLHMRLQGEQLGTFDVFFDSLSPEQFWAGQTKVVEGTTYYDLWTSFALGKTGRGQLLGTESMDTQVVISRYKIRADIKPPTTVNADTRAEIEVREGGLRTLFFELPRFLQVKQVEADGRPVEFINNPAIDGTQLARRGNDLVAVVFPAPLRAGQKIELRFVYGGDVLSEAGGGLLYVGARGTWYPNRGIIRSDFDMEFHYPSEWTLLATGKRIPCPIETASRNEGVPVAGEQSSRWVSDNPRPWRDLTSGNMERRVVPAE